MAKGKAAKWIKKRQQRQTSVDVKEAVNQASGGSTISKIERGASSDVSGRIDGRHVMSSVDKMGKEGKNRLDKTWEYWKKNALNSVDGDWGDFGVHMARQAGKGAVGGAAIGGTMEAAQGGSFWTGAKEGAFNGALGYGAHRGLAAGFSATGSGVRNTYGGMMGAMGMTSKTHETAIRGASKLTRAQRDTMTDVSKSVDTLMRKKPTDGVSKNMLNGGNKI